MTVIERLIAHWKSHGIEPPEGVAAADVVAFETCHNVCLPSDFRSYFLAVNGMGSREFFDNDFFCFWSFEEVISIAEDLPDRCSRFKDSARYFIFADHAFMLPAFAIRLSADPNEANPIAGVFADNGALEVEDFCESFTDFVIHYIEAPLDTSAGLSSHE